jgi:hypothetical protein
MATKRRLAAISLGVQGVEEDQPSAEGLGSANWTLRHLLRTCLGVVEDFCFLETGEDS